MKNPDSAKTVVLFKHCPIPRKHVENLLRFHGISSQQVIIQEYDENTVMLYGSPQLRDQLQIQMQAIHAEQKLHRGMNTKHPRRQYPELYEESASSLTEKIKAAKKLPGAMWQSVKGLSLES